MNNRAELIKKLQTSDAIYVLMSGYTRMPYVVCDQETFDDEVLIYFSEEGARQAAKELLDEGNPIHIIKVEKHSLLQFYTSLFPMGVNCLRIEKGTPDETTFQHGDLVKRPEPENEENGKKRVENQELHLTALYFIQEFRKNKGKEMSEELKEIYDEMRVHFGRGSYIIPTQDGQGIPVLKQQEGNEYLPLFTDLLEFQKFNHDGKFKGAIIKAEKIPDLMSDTMTGVTVNPAGMNLLLNIAKPQ